MSQQETFYHVVEDEDEDDLYSELNERVNTLTKKYDKLELLVKKILGFYEERHELSKRASYTMYGSTRNKHLVIGRNLHR